MDTQNTFVFDYYYVMSLIQLRANPKNERETIPEALIMFFLINWGFDMDVVMDTSKTFLKLFEKKEIPDFEVSYRRLIDYVKNDSFAIEQLIVQATTVMSINLHNDIAGKNSEFIGTLGESLDLRPSELERYMEKGFKYCQSLLVFAEIYSNTKK